MFPSRQALRPLDLLARGERETQRNSCVACPLWPERAGDTEDTVLQLRSVGRLRAGRKLQAEVGALSEGAGGIEGHVAAEDGWVFSTFASSLAEDASALFPAGCPGWQLPKLAGEGQVRPGSEVMTSVPKHMRDLRGSQRLLGEDLQVA